MSQTIVIGAGIVGATTAYYLAKAGHEVMVLDAQAEAGLDTSFANGGLLAANSALPWSSPGTPLQLLKWIGREEAPLLLRPSAVPALTGWGPRFLSNCRPRKYLETASTLTRLGQYSLGLLDALVVDEPLTFDRGEGGFLEIFKGAEGAAGGERFASMLEANGAIIRRLTAAQCVELEPSLAPVGDSIALGLLLERDSWGDARAFSVAIADAARRLGVDIRYGVSVSSIEVAHGRVTGVRTNLGPLPAHRIVLCGASGSLPLLGALGIHLPIAPVKGYSLTLAREDIGFLPQRPIVDDYQHMGVTPLGDRLRVAGTVEFAGFDRTLRPGRVENLKNALLQLFPQMQMPEQVNAWCGLRPMSADGLPFIDRTPVDNLIVNTGHGALGWTLACGSAEIVSGLTKGEQPKEGLPFRMDRRIW